MIANNLNQLHHWCSISAAAAAPVLETFLKCASLNYPSFEIHLATLPDVLCYFSGCTSISTVTLPMVQDQAGGAGGPGGPGGLQGGLAPSPSPSLNLQFLDLTDCVRLMDAGLHLIAKNSPHLRQLYLRRCINITGKIYYYYWLMMLFVYCYSAIYSEK